jgi:hypothetical protein
MSYKTSKTSYRQQRSNAKWAKMAALGLALFGLFCFVKVWQNVTVDQLSRRNDKLLKELKIIEGKNISLFIEQERLMRLDRVQLLAKNNLNYVKAPTIRIKTVN